MLLEEVTQCRTSRSLVMYVFVMWLPKEDEHHLGKARVLEEVTKIRIIKPLAMRGLFTGLQLQDEHILGSVRVRNRGLPKTRALCVLRKPAETCKSKTRICPLSLDVYTRVFNAYLGAITNPK